MNASSGSGLWPIRMTCIESPFGGAVRGLRPRGPRLRRRPYLRLRPVGARVGNAPGPPALPVTHRLIHLSTAVHRAPSDAAGAALATGTPRITATEGALRAPTPRSPRQSMLCARLPHGTRMGTDETSA